MYDDEWIDWLYPPQDEPEPASYELDAPITEWSDEWLDE